MILFVCLSGFVGTAVYSYTYNYIYIARCASEPDHAHCSKPCNWLIRAFGPLFASKPKLIISIDITSRQFNTLPRASLATKSASRQVLLSSVLTKVSPNARAETRWQNRNLTTRLSRGFVWFCWTSSKPNVHGTYMAIVWPFLCDQWWRPGDDYGCDSRCDGSDSDGWVLGHPFWGLWQQWDRTGGRIR